MDRKIALKWARALESGEYEQARSVLRDPDNNSFCCLGVLCNLHAQMHPEIAAEQLEPDYYLGEDANLPEEVGYWSGIKLGGTFADGFKLKIRGVDGGGEAYDEDEPEYARGLIDLNDDYEWNFAEIAKFIRKHSDKL